MCTVCFQLELSKVDISVLNILLAIVNCKATWNNDSVSLIGLLYQKTVTKQCKFDSVTECSGNRYENVGCNILSYIQQKVESKT